LLPDLRNNRGKMIPVIIFCAQDADLPLDEQVQATLCKLNAPLTTLVATVRDRLAHLPTRTVLEVT
jgi:hypothetical protein